jgi:hypothetical protein
MNPSIFVISCLTMSNWVTSRITLSEYFSMNSFVLIDHWFGVWSVSTLAAFPAGRTAVGVARLARDDASSESGILYLDIGSINRMGRAFVGEGNGVHSDVSPTLIHP